MTTVCDAPQALASAPSALSFTEPAGVLFSHEDFEMLKHQIDGAVFTVATANLFGAVPWPEVAGFISACYMTIRFYETRTIQHIVNWVRAKLRKVF